MQRAWEGASNIEKYIHDGNQQLRGMSNIADNVFVDTEFLLKITVKPMTSEFILEIRTFVVLIYGIAQIQAHRPILEKIQYVTAPKM